MVFKISAFKVQINDLFLGKLSPNDILKRGDKISYFRTLETAITEVIFQYFVNRKTHFTLLFLSLQGLGLSIHNSPK